MGGARRRGVRAGAHDESIVFFAALVLLFSSSGAESLAESAESDDTDAIEAGRERPWIGAHAAL